MRTDQLWAEVDPLGEALHLLRMSGTFYFRSELTSPWGMTLPPMPDCIWFHVVTAGRALLDTTPAPGTAADAPRLLQPGDLALVPHGAGHRLRSEASTDAPSVLGLPHDFVTQRYAVIRHGGGGEPTTLVCGAVRFGHPAARTVAALLPSTMHLEGSSTARSEWLQSTMRLMAVEAAELRPGGEAVITRLADILVIHAIRAWLESDPAARTGWLGALYDRQIGRVLALVHREPARAWTVATLAAEAAMSRSAFAARFTSLVGEPAMQYVTRWRMQTALTWLTEDAMPVGRLADRLGYRSEAAFSRAFTRVMGMAPTAARRSAAAEPFPAGPSGRPGLGDAHVGSRG